MVLALRLRCDSRAACLAVLILGVRSGFAKRNAGEEAIDLELAVADSDAQRNEFDIGVDASLIRRTARAPYLPLESNDMNDAIKAAAVEQLKGYATSSLQAGDTPIGNKDKLKEELGMSIEVALTECRVFQSYEVGTRTAKAAMELEGDAKDNQKIKSAAAPVQSIEKGLEVARTALQTPNRETAMVAVGALMKAFTVEADAGCKSGLAKAFEIAQTLKDKQWASAEEIKSIVNAHVDGLPGPWSEWD